MGKRSAIWNFFTDSAANPEWAKCKFSSSCRLISTKHCATSGLKFKGLQRFKAKHEGRKTGTAYVFEG